MSGCFGGCLGRVLALLLLVIVVVAAWRFGPELAERLPEWRRAGPESVSPVVADRAAERYARLTAGEIDELRLSGAELESVLRYRLAQEFPPGVQDPEVDLRGDEVRARLRVAMEILPTIPELDGVRGVLPDTVPVELRGVVVTLEGGRAAFIIRRIDAAGVPIPGRFHGAIASALDPGRPPGLPDASVEIPLPPGVRALRVEEGVLVLRGGG